MGETTFYFNSHSDPSPYDEWTDPDNMKDNNTSTFGSASGTFKKHDFDDNSATSKPGAITAVYVRWCRKGSQNGSSNLKISGEARYSAGNSGFIWDDTFTTNSSYSAWHDITSLTNAPSTWTWSDLDDLGLTLTNYDVNENQTVYVSVAEIKVEHGILDTLEEEITATDEVQFVTGLPVYYYEPSTSVQFTITSPEILEFGTLEEDDSLIRNDVTVIGTSVRASTSDSTSITTYGRYKYRYENTDITDSSDAATIAGQILENYKDPKVQGSFKIRGKTGINTRQQFILDVQELGITSQQYEIVQYQHNIDDTGFYTTIYFGQVPWDITREVANLVRTVY